MLSHSKIKIVLSLICYHSFIPCVTFGFILFVFAAEPYTVREARIHVRHIRDLLKSLDPSDAYNGVDCNSLSFLSIFTDGDLGGTRRSFLRQGKCLSSVC